MDRLLPADIGICHCARRIHDEARRLRVALEYQVMPAAEKAARYWACRLIESRAKLVEQQHGPSNPSRIDFEDGHLTQTPVNALVYYQNVGVSVHYHMVEGWVVTVFHDKMSGRYRRKHARPMVGFSTRDEAAELATEIVMDLLVSPEA